MQRTNTPARRESRRGAASVLTGRVPSSATGPGSTGAAADCHVELTDHIHALRRYAWVLVRNHADADDLVQECLKRALLYLNGSSRIENLRNYLFTILHNTRIDMAARQRREGVKVPIDDASISSNGTPQSDQLVCRQVLDAIQLLSEDHREILILVAVEGFSYRDTAKILGIAVGTVMSRVSRARASLREILGIDDALTEVWGPG